MRIAFLADPLDRQYGGIHVFTKEILNSISKLDKKNEYIIIRSEQKNEFEGIEEIVLPYQGFPGYRFWRLFFEIPKILIKKKVDIVVEPAHFGPFNLPRRIKRVTVIHDMTMFLFPEHHLFFSQFIQRLVLPRILRKADHIISNSQSTKADIVRFFPFTIDKTTSILLGKSESFKPSLDREVLQKYKVRGPYFLFVGTLEPRKNVSNLVKAFEAYKSDSGAMHQLVLVGKEGWKARGIIDTIEQSPYQKDIRNLGFVDKEDLPALYSMADLFIYPSIYEGFGLPVLEAMSCGTAVITSDVSSLPEVGGDAVMYCEPNSVDHLSQCITTLSSDIELRKKHAVLGFQQSLNFSWDKAAKEYIHTFESLLP